MPTVSSYFNSMAQKTQGLDPIFRGITYSGSDYSNRLQNMDSVNLSGQDLVIKDYTVELDNKDLSLSFLVLSRWPGQTLNIDFGFLTGSGTDTQQIFTGKGNELNLSKDTLTINAEGKFAFLGRQKIGSTNSPVLYIGSDQNPADLWWTVATSHGGLPNSKFAGNEDIDFISWGSWHGALEVIGLTVEGQLENTSIIDFFKEIAENTGSYIFEDEGKFNFNFYSPTNPGISAAIVLDESFYNEDPEATLIDVANKVNVFHGFDTTSDVFTGQATEVNSDSVGSFGTIEETFDSERVWHSTSKSADQFANRTLKAFDAGNLRIELEGDLPLWLFNIGDRVALTVNSFGINGEQYSVREFDRDPDTRKVDLTLESDEPWQTFFFLDFAANSGSFGLLDQSFNPIY